MVSSKGKHLTFSPLTNRVVLPSNGAYYDSRLDQIELVVLHTAECDLVPNAAFAVCSYLSRTQPPNRASCHYCTDPWEIVGQCHEEWTAWTAPGANANGINIEQAGRAHQTDWNSPLAQQMIMTKTVPLVADICKRRGLPPLILEASELIAERKGITDHRRVNDAFHRSDHTDCGSNYPIQQVRIAVANLLGVEPIIPGKKDEDDMKIVTSDSGTIYLVGGGMKTALVPAPNWNDTLWAINQLLASGVASEWIQQYTDNDGVVRNGVPQGALDRVADGLDMIP